MKVIDSAGWSAKRMPGILGRIFFFFHVIFGRRDVDNLIQPGGAYRAALVMVH
jgi:hypothetical protein